MILLKIKKKYERFNYFTSIYALDYYSPTLSLTGVSSVSIFAKAPLPGSISSAVSAYWIRPPTSKSADVILTAPLAHWNNLFQVFPFTTNPARKHAVNFLIKLKSKNFYLFAKLRPSPSSSFCWPELSLNSNSDHPPTHPPGHPPTHPPIRESLFLG